MVKKGGPRPVVLVGWDHIAEFMACSVATAKRRENDGLPIVRCGGSVCSLPEDVEGWMQTHGAGGKKKAG